MKWNKLLLRKSLAIVGIAATLGSSIAVTIVEAKTTGEVIETGESGKEQKMGLKRSLLNPEGKVTSKVYEEDYEGADEVPSIAYIKGSGVQTSLSEGRLKMELPSSEVVFTYDAFPKMKDGIISFDFESNIPERIGFLAQVDEENAPNKYIAVSTHNDGKWDVGCPGNWQTIGANYKLAPNERYNMQIELYGNQIGFSIYSYTANEVVMQGIKAVSNRPQQIGDFAFKSWFSTKAIYIDNFKVEEYFTADKTLLEEKIKELKEIDYYAYTTASWEDVQEAVIYAEQVVNNGQAEQIADAIRRLQVAEQGLIKAELRLLYGQDYNGENTDINWTTDAQVEDGQLKFLLPSSEVVFWDKNSPQVADGVVEFDFTTDKPGTVGRYGFVVRAKSEPDNLSITTHNEGKWFAGPSKEGTRWPEILSNHMIEANKKYHVKLRYKGDLIHIEFRDATTQELIVEGETKVVSAKEPGYFGLKSWFAGKTIYLDNLNIYEYRPTAGINTVALEALIAEVEKLNSSDYIQEGWLALQNILGRAKKLVKEELATQGQIDRMVKELENAVSNLIPDTRRVYEVDYVEGTTPNWDNLGEMQVIGGILEGALSSQAIAVDKDSPKIANGTYKFKLQTDTQNMGVVCQYVDARNYLAIYHVGNGVWKLERSGQEPVTINSDGPVLEVNKQNLVRIDLVDGSLDFYLNNEKVWSGEVESQSGQIGLINKSGEKAKVGVDYLLAHELFVYKQDYEDQTQTQKWTTPNIAYDEGWLKINPAAVDTVFDKHSPMIKDGTWEFKFKTSASGGANGGRYRFAFRGKDKENYGNVAYDINGNWKGYDAKTMEADTVYDMKVEFQGDTTRLWIDGQYMGASTGSSGESYGHIGLGSWYGAKTFWIDDVRLVESPNYKPEDLGVNPQVISSDQMSVVFDDKFPRIMRYEWASHDKTLAGQKAYGYGMKINGQVLYPKVESRVVAPDTITYEMSFEEIGVGITCQYKVEGNVLNFNVTQITEANDFRVESIQFMDQQVISTEETLLDSSYAAVLSTGGWHGLSEEIVDDLGQETSLKVETKAATMGMLSGNGLAASIENNVINGYDKLSVTKSLEQGSKRVGMGNGTWTYRFKVNDNGQYPGLPEHEELPWFKVVLTEDTNGDQKTSWQDGAVALRQIINPVVGEEKMRDYHMYIPNHGEGEGDNFLTTLDYGKVIYNYTDGFGQMPLWKGYQLEGHDDSHPDYDHIGRKQGGVKDFNYLIEEGKKYNMDMGIHINASEFMLDAFQTQLENLSGYESGSLRPNWHWSEQAYYVDENKDVMTGELERRLKELKQVAPDLSFIYVDIYAGNDYAGMKLKRIVNELGWILGTEFPGPLLPGAAITHWGTDLNYPNKGNKSQIMRFVQNDLDIYSAHPLLKGQRMTGAGGWSSDGANNLKQTVTVFNEEILPGKYMQYFDILKWDEKHIEFSDGVVSEVNNGRIELSKDGKLLAYWEDTTHKTHPEERHLAPATTLIPWNPLTEDKLYHWNVTGESTTWELPNSWENQTRVDVYELTKTDKVLVKTIPVVDGEITLDLEAKTPYMVYKHGETPSAAAANWGEGENVADFGFESGGFEYWQKESTADSTEHIQVKQIDKPLGTDANRNYTSYLEIGQEDAVVSQEIKGLEPGKTYTIGVFSKVAEGRSATLEVVIDGKTYSRTLTEHDLIQTGYYSHKGSTAQELSVDFKVPQNNQEAVVRLKANSGVGTVEFDDLIVFEHNVPTEEQSEEYVIYEDFENVHRSFGPFKKGPVKVRANLSEKDMDPNTRQPLDFVLEGQWSLKTEGSGEILQTQQSTLELEPNTTYEVGLLAQAGNGISGDIIVKSRKNSEDTVLRQPIAKGTTTGEVLAGDFEIHGEETKATFTTGNATDYYIAIDATMSSGYACHEHSLFIDNFYVKKVKEPELENPRASLKVDTQVLAGRSFEGTLFLEDIKDKVYAGDFEMLYDTEVFEFVEAKGISPTMVIKSQEEQGKVRVLTATEGGLDSEVDAITFKFMTKRNPVSTSSAISISNALIGVMDGDQSASLAIDGMTKEISVKPVEDEVDKVELKKLIEEAKKLAREAITGYLPGQYPLEAKETFEIAIQVAEQVAISSTSQVQVDQGITDLRIAIEDFKASINPVEDGDIDGDGTFNVSDLALVAYYYQQVEQDNPNWEQAKKADINKDGKIDIFDLTMMASKILNK